MDDPTIALIQVVNSWEQAVPTSANKVDFYSLDQSILDQHIHPRVNSVPASTINNFDPIYVDSKLFNELLSLKNRFGGDNMHKIYTAARNLANPYEYVGRSIFTNNRAGVKMANLDSIFNLTGHNGGYIAQATFTESNNFNIYRDEEAIEIDESFKTTEVWPFADIAGGPGGFSQYLLWRRPTATGYGITLANPDNNALTWREDLKRSTNFNIYDGPDKTGDIYTHYNDFVDYVLYSEPSGVNLAFADGGFDTSGQEDQEEFITSRLIMLEILMAIRVVRYDDYNRGTIMIKLLDTNSQFMAELLYLVARVFEKVWLVKPITSRPANSEKYLVARGVRQQQRDDVISILTEAAQLFEDGQVVTSFLAPNSQPPPDFKIWLRRINQQMTQRQIDQAQRILPYMVALSELSNSQTYSRQFVDRPYSALTPEMRTKILIEITQRGVEVPDIVSNIDLYKALVVWNVPGNRDRRFRVKNPRRNQVSRKDMKQSQATQGGALIRAGTGLKGTSIISSGSGLGGVIANINQVINDTTADNVAEIVEVDTATAVSTVTNTNKITIDDEINNLEQQITALTAEAELIESTYPELSADALQIRGRISELEVNKNQLIATKTTSVTTYPPRPSSPRIATTITTTTVSPRSLPPPVSDDLNNGDTPYSVMQNANIMPLSPIAPIAPISKETTPVIISKPTILPVTQVSSVTPVAPVTKSSLPIVGTSGVASSRSTGGGLLGLIRKKPTTTGSVGNVIPQIKPVSALPIQTNQATLTTPLPVASVTSVAPKVTKETVRPIRTISRTATTPNTNVVRQTVTPTIAPVISPTIAPAVTPSIAPTIAPTIAPVISPTIAPAVTPSIAHTIAPTITPSIVPAIAPTVTPSVTQNKTIKVTNVRPAVLASPSSQISSSSPAVPSTPFIKAPTTSSNTVNVITKPTTTTATIKPVRPAVTKPVVRMKIKPIVSPFSSTSKR